MKRMLALMAFFSPLALFGQHEWVYTMQSFNVYDGVGAAAGMYDQSALNVRMRSQWLGVEGAPQTALASYQTRLNQRLGLGVRVMAEEIGAFNRNALVSHLSWRTRLAKGELAFALGGGVVYEKIARERINALHADDPVFTGANDQWAPLVNASVMYRNERFFIGVEAQHLLPRESTWGALTTAGKVTEVVALLGASVSLSEDWSLRPLAALRYNAAGALLPEVQAGMWYRQNFWFGGGYRYESAAYAFAEYRIRSRYRLAYSFGWPLMQWSPSMAGNHELMLGVFWGKTKLRTLESVRYFQ